MKSCSEPVKYPPHWNGDELPPWLAPYSNLVSEAWREADGSYRVRLKPGLVTSTVETHCIHETSQKNVLSQLRHSIVPCLIENCSVCKGS